MHQIAKHAAALRDAKTQRVPDARAFLRHQRIVFYFVPQERNKVADRGKADAHHDRIAGAVDELIDRATVEARPSRARDLDMAVVDQTPRKTGRRDARIGLALPHRQRRTVRVSHRIDERADETLLGQLLDVAVAEQPGVFGDELLPYHAGDTGDDRKARSQVIGARRHVTLPAAPYEGEAAPHQKAVAGMLGVPALGRTVEPRHDRLVAAIGHVVDEAPIATIEIERLQDPEVALILDEALRVARGPIEVDDPDIQGMCRIEFAEYRAVQPFIAPDGAEFRAAKHRPFPLGHLDPPHAANAHVVLPTEPAIGGSLATSQGYRKRAPFLPSTLADTVRPGCIDAVPCCLADGCQGGNRGANKTVARQCHKVFVARAAPSASAASFVQPISACTRPPMPQSAPPTTFSRPTMPAQSTRRRAMSSGCSTMLVA